MSTKKIKVHLSQTTLWALADVRPSLSTQSASIYAATKSIPSSSPALLFYPSSTSSRPTWLRLSMKSALTHAWYLLNSAVASVPAHLTRMPAPPG